MGPQYNIQAIEMIARTACASSFSETDSDFIFTAGVGVSTSTFHPAPLSPPSFSSARSRKAKSSSPMRRKSSRTSTTGSTSSVSSCLRPVSPCSCLPCNGEVTSKHYRFCSLLASNADRLQIRLGQRNSHRLVLRLRRQHRRLGCLQLLERRQSTHPLLDDGPHSRMVILPLPRCLDGSHDG